MKRVFVALGSNLGDSKDLVRRAMDRLETLSSVPIARSSLWRSAPVDCPPGSHDFINAVVVMEPLAETPEAFLRELQAMEREFGRTPKKALNEARPLDLDLIAWGTEVRNGSELILPHPRAHERAFVLAPLAEIAPDFVLPGQSKTVGQLLGELRSEGIIERLGE
jgi:2-amino-4-hydroxy-6-hydroxymethyldihydropteridine diphosphokinase